MTLTWRKTFGLEMNTWGSKNQVVLKKMFNNYRFLVIWPTTFCCSNSIIFSKISLQLLKLLKCKLSILSRISCNWLHVSCMALWMALKSLQSDWSTSDKMFVIHKTSSRKQIWSTVCGLSMWSRIPISSAFGSFEIISSSDSIIIGYLSLVLLQATPWESQRVTAALTMAKVLTP